MDYDEIIELIKRKLMELNYFTSYQMYNMIEFRNNNHFIQIIILENQIILNKLVDEMVSVIKINFYDVHEMIDTLTGVIRDIEQQ